MSEPLGEGEQPGNELQFDQVEYAQPTPSEPCSVCGQPLQAAYYDIQGKPACPGCRDEILKALQGGSAVGRFARATVYGSLAGVAGAVIYYGVREATNINFGLISIVVGLLIGQAVKKGCNGRGGWFYQGLAMFLTYTAIVATYIPPLVKMIREKAAEETAAAKTEKAEKPAAEEAVPEDPAKPRPTLGQALFALAFLIGFAYAIPILSGFQSPMGLIIIGIGLYEAWVINRRVRLEISGPYQIGAAGGAANVEPAG
jgi:hypothetical protein